MTEANTTATLNATELTEEQEKLAQALYQAYLNHKPLDMAEWVGKVSDDESGYRVQQRLMELKDQPVGGYKVSLTSQETQDMFKANEPLYGAQVQSHFVPSPATLSLSAEMMDPLAEVELVFKAKEDLSVNDSVEDLRQKTTVAAGVEVPDARFADWFPSLDKYLVMSDAAVGGFVVYGPEQDSSSLPMKDFKEVKAQLFHDNEMVAEGVSSEVLGNPFESLHWLVAKLHEQGKTLKAGQRVSSGTFLLPPHLTKGEWVAKFSHNFNPVVVKVVD
ncbi:2-keto-4-pentenoate hydratase [Lactobacillaceae bacterium L1_55_11]|nr:2-keto-4-pentenoate hydratase [Lactobacillaceae bacterium L1_55_11]